MDPWSDEQQAEFEKKFRKVISEQDQASTAQGYEDIREIVRVEMITQARNGRRAEVDAKPSEGW